MTLPTTAFMSTPKSQLGEPARPTRAVRRGSRCIDVDDSRFETGGKYSENIGFPDGPITDFRNHIQTPTHFFCDGLRIHELLK